MFSLARERYHNIDSNFKLAVIRLVFTFGTAAAGTVWGLYLHHIGFSNAAVGYVTGIITLLSASLSLIGTPILEFFQARRLLMFSLLLYTVTYLLVAVTTDKIVFIVLAAAVAVATNFRVESFAIVFRDSTSREKLAGREGLMFALVNLGWLITPAFAGVILVRYGFASVFELAASAFFVAFAMLALNRKLRMRKPFDRIDGNVFANIARFARRRTLWYPYLVRLGLNAVNGFVLIYLPVFAVERGMSPVYIGAAISAMALIHTLFDFSVGQAAARRGFRTFLVFGFMAIAVLLVGASFLQSGYALLFLIPLIGLATLFIEPLQDSFFFTLVDKAEDEERLYPVYSTANQLGGFAGKALVATVLLVASEQFAFLFIAFLVMVVALALVSFKERPTPARVHRAGA